MGDDLDAGAEREVGRREQKQRDDLLGLRVTGTMPVTVRGVGYERRIESPLP